MSPPGPISPTGASISPAGASVSLAETSLAALEAQITELAGHLNAANYRWLTLIGEFDRRQGWGDGKLPSCAHWLNFKCGLNLGAARERVRVAHALEGLPKIAASMARGELSYSKVRALTRVACKATEENFLMIALHGTAYHVERLVQGYRRAQEAEELSREAQQHAQRSVSYWFDADGSLILKARLPALAGALVIKALDAALERVPSREINADRVSECTLSFEHRRADALAAVAEGYLAESDSASSSADRYQVVVHVDAETLHQRTAGRCEIEHGPALPAETARRLACDASLLELLENERGEPLDVGRKTRSIPPAIRRALNSRDGGCRFPGCTHQRYLDAHHIEHWAEGGDTKLANLVTLCRLHHRLVHEGGITVQLQPGGGWRFLHPDGRHFEIVRHTRTVPYRWEDLQHTHTELGIHIDPDTAATRWRGERMDYDLGVWVLCQQANAARRTRRTDVDGAARGADRGVDDADGGTYRGATRNATGDAGRRADDGGFGGDGDRGATHGAGDVDGSGDAGLGATRGADDVDGVDGGNGDWSNAFEDVSAETFAAEQDAEHDTDWWASDTVDCTSHREDLMRT
jgi:hypothetical protein